MQHQDALEDLLSRVALGDRAAFRRLYERTSAKLFGVCLRILKDRGEAEDVMQEAFVKIWRSAGGYTQSNARPISWLAAIARNQSIDRLRARRPAAADLDDIVDAADDAPSPEAQAVASDDRMRLERCMDGLELDHAAALRSAFLEGYTYEELAQRMAVPLGTMKSWIRRSLLKLKDCLQR